MSSDIITSAPHPRDLRSIVREAQLVRDPQQGRAQPPTDARIAIDALSRIVRRRVGTLRARVRSVTGAALRVGRRPVVDRTAAPANGNAPVQRTGTEATIHVLRVRARLLPAEQRLFDDLLLEGAVDQLIGMLVRRSEDEALALLRRQLGSVEPSVSLAALARRIGGLRSQLTIEEYDRAISRLPHLSPDEHQSLHAHLLWTDPTEAAALIRAYLAPSLAPSRS